MPEAYEYNIIKEGEENILRIDVESLSYLPSIEDNAAVMSKVIDILTETAQIAKIIFIQKRDYEYDYYQTQLLVEIAQLYKRLSKQKELFAFHAVAPTPRYQKFFQEKYSRIQLLIFRLLREDPLGAYVVLKRSLRRENTEIEKIVDPDYLELEQHYIDLLTYLANELEKTKLITIAKPYLPGYQLGNREVYRKFFRPAIKPDFMFTKLMAAFPAEGIEIGAYDIKNTDITIFKMPDSVQYLYHMMPPEFKLNEDQYEILDTARRIMAEHKPERQEFIDPERMRAVFYNVGHDLIEELAEHKEIKIRPKEIDELTTILVRYTVGFGLIEVLLQDPKIQDVTINSPMGINPMFIVHAEYGDCKTNIIPTTTEAESWASKLRLISGRPLDEANPILDTEITIPEARARVGAISQPLNPTGLAYAFRRHRMKPWTLALFVQNKMIDPLAAGILSFLVDGTRTMLVAGTRSAGKTSLLGSLLVEIMRRYRIITIEDSVTEDSKIIVKDKGKFKKTTIGKLIDYQIKKHGYIDFDGREKVPNLENIKIFSINKDGKVVLSKPNKFIRHKVNKQIYEIKTTSGKKIKITEDHSLFTLDKKEILRPIKSKNIKEGSFIAIPKKLPFDNSLESIDLLDYLNKLDKKIFIFGEEVKEYIVKNRKKLFSLAYSLGYKKSTIQNWTRKKILPVKIFEKIRNKIKNKNLMIKSYSSSRALSSEIVLDKDFLIFIGLWLADGCYDKSSIIISVQEEENRKVVRKIADRFKIPVKMHSDKFSFMLNSALLKEIMQKVLKLDGNSYTKKIPNWAYNLSDKQVGWVLKGFFSRDGCVSDKEIVFSICSKELSEDISDLLLRFGIILRTSDRIRRDKTFNCRIGSTKMIKKFQENIGFLVKSKQDKLIKLASRISTHDTTDTIPLSLEIKNELSKILGKRFNKHDYIIRKNNIGRRHLNNLLEMIPERITNPIDSLKKIVKSDIFWDKVKSIKKVKNKEYVYDISVPECENFICESIVAHNTLELPVDPLRKFGFNIQSMKVRSALLRGGAEVSAAEGIRTSLRLGDSALIIGEVRSKEAIALFESMRIGAMANVVAGTIHGESPYGVFDRIVNDLGVPRTSFKATDIVVVCNPIRSPDGIHKWRRVTQITEVRKEWEKDPMLENGFVDLMKYDAVKDMLEPSGELINGNSDVLKSIAANVKEWAGKWDAVWDNILLRAKTKETLVKYAEKAKRLDFLEADFVILANDMFHKFSEQIKEETGSLDSKKIFFNWDTWLKREIKKRTTR